MLLQSFIRAVNCKEVENITTNLSMTRLLYTTQHNAIRIVLYYFTSDNTHQMPINGSRYRVSSAAVDYGLAAMSGERMKYGYILLSSKKTAVK